MASDLITVKSAGERVGLFETDPRHPNGEAFVTQTPVKVARTRLVERKLESGELVEVKPSKTSTKSDK